MATGEKDALAGLDWSKAEIRISGRGGGGGSYGGGGLF